MKRIVLIVLTVLLAIPAFAAEETVSKPLKPSDFDALRIIDLEAAVVKERFLRISETFRAEVLRLQIQDGAVGCSLSQEKRAWVCPKPDEKPKESAR